MRHTFPQDWRDAVVFGDDGASLFVTDDLGRVPVHVYRLDLRSGRRDPWLELAPPDRAGVLLSQGPWLTPNGRFYAYSYVRSCRTFTSLRG